MWILSFVVVLTQLTSRLGNTSTAYLHSVKMTNVRFCKALTHELADISNDNNDMEQPDFKGVANFLLNEGIDAVYRGIPFPVNRSQSNFNRVPDFCLNDLRDNKTDVALGIFSYPPFNYWSQFKTQHTIDKVYPYEVPFEYHTVIISAYNITRDYDKIDFLTYSIGIFDWQVWVTIFAFLWVFYMVLRFGNGVSRNQQHSSFWQVVSHALLHGNGDCIGYGLSLLYLILTMFCFSVATFFSNMITTDSIAYKKPSVIKSYQDVLDRGVDVYTFHFTGDLDELDRFPEGTPAANLRQKLLSNPEKFILNGDSLAAFIDLIPRVVRGRSVLLMSRMLSEVCISTALTSGFVLNAPGVGDKNFYRMWRGKDPSAGIRQAGFMMRTEFMRSNPFGQRMRRKMKTLHEVGVVKYFVDKLDRGISINGKSEVNETFFREMTRKDLAVLFFEDTPQTKLYTLENLLKMSFIGMVVIPLLVLVVEFCRHRKRILQVSDCDTRWAHRVERAAMTSLSLTERSIIHPQRQSISGTLTNDKKEIPSPLLLRRVSV